MTLAITAMTLFRTTAKMMFGLLPARIELLRQFCERYVDRYNADNDSNPATNGEERLLRHDADA